MSVVMDVRRMAAIDMHGLAGSWLRRRVILVEFVAGAVGCFAFGLLTATRSAGLGWRAVGVWLAGVGVNYVVLALHAAWLSRPGALEGELAGVDVRGELRRYTRLQLWIVVPLVLVAFGARQVRQRPSPLR